MGKTINFRQAAPKISKFIEDGPGHDQKPKANDEPAGLIRGRNGRVRQRRVVYLAKDTDEQLQAYCAEHGRDMSETMGLALELFFAKRGA